jgi:drug/metabolite transporter (DMT)-like permease
MVAWGFNVIGTKILVVTFPPLTLTAFRIFTAGISVFIILSFLKQVRLPSKREFYFIFVGSIFNVFGHQSFLSIGLKETSATNGGLILGLSPLLTTLLAIFLLGTRITLLKVTGIISGLIGVSLILLKDGGSLSEVALGDIYVFVSILSIAISFILIKKAATTLDPKLMTGYMLVIGSFMLFILSLFMEPNGLQGMTNGSPSIWLLFFASAVISTALGHMFYNYAIGKVGAAETAIFTNLSPFFAVVGAVLFLNESLAFAQVLGFLFIIAGVMLGSGAIDEIIRNRKRRQGIAA